MCRIFSDKINLKCGNIILFYNETEKRYVIHRIVKVNMLKNGEYYYVTKGDKNLIVDEYLVKYKDVRGVI